MTESSHAVNSAIEKALENEISRAEKKFRKNIGRAIAVKVHSFEKHPFRNGKLAVIDWTPLSRRDGGSTYMDTQRDVPVGNPYIVMALEKALEHTPAEIIPSTVTAFRLIEKAETGAVGFGDAYEHDIDVAAAMFGRLGM